MTGIDPIIADAAVRVSMRYAAQGRLLGLEGDDLVQSAICRYLADGSEEPRFPYRMMASYVIDEMRAISHTHPNNKTGGRIQAEREWFDEVEEIAEDEGDYRLGAVRMILIEIYHAVSSKLTLRERQYFVLTLAGYHAVDIKRMLGGTEALWSKYRRRAIEKTRAAISSDLALLRG